MFELPTFSCQVLIIVLGYQGTTLPYRLAFHAPATGLEYSFVVFCEMFLLVDICKNCRTGFHDRETGTLTRDGTLMLKKYMKGPSRRGRGRGR